MMNKRMRNTVIVLTVVVDIPAACKDCDEAWIY